MAVTAQITATPRSDTGKGAARSHRRGGRVPGILYGHGEESISLSVDANELSRLVNAISIENTLVDLELEGTKQPYKVLIRELQTHPFKSDVLHIDFFHIAMDEKITVDVPLALVGVPEGVKNKGGVVDHQLREIQVSCLPSDIPEQFEVDISALDIGDSIHVGELEVGDIEILVDPDRSVVNVLAPTVIVEEEEEEELEEEMEEPEVIGRVREEGEEGAEAPEGSAEAEGEEKE